ncbi:hypothetical protein JCM1841_003678 [Sporobolomyces salmonicolor]
MASTSSSAAMEPLPPTQLPSDPTLLSRYLRSQQLASLRRLYEYKTDMVAKDIAAQYDASRGRGGRARRRRGSSPLVEERNLEEEDEQDDFEVRKLMKYDPALEEPTKEEEQYQDKGDIQGTAEILGSLADDARRRKEEVAIDPAHTYDLVFDLSPDSSADAYYHGPHPPPPARIVRTVLRATRKKPFVDPTGLSTAQLESLANHLWTEEGKAVSVLFGERGRARHQPLTREQERAQRDMNADEEQEWEESVIAGFSATCDEKIGRSLAKRPMTAREMQAQAQAAAQQAAAQQQQQAQHPLQQVPMSVAGYPPPVLSPFGDRDGFSGQPGAPYWR